MKNIRVNKNFIRTSKPIGENFTILTMSDFHLRNDNYFHRLYEIVSLVELIKPSIICIPGDLLDTFNVVNDDPILRQKVLAIIERISKMAPVFISFASHDYDIKAIDSKILLENWFNELSSIQNVTIFAPAKERPFAFNDEVTIGGFSLPLDAKHKLENSAEINKFMQPIVKSLNFNERTYNIMIFHSPIFAFDKNGLKPRKTIGLENVNLGLSGHCHAGLAPKILEPLNIGFATPDKSFFPTNVAGLFSLKEEEFNLLISRGMQKIPGTIMEEFGITGKILYGLNQLYTPDIDLLTINGTKRKIYNI